MDCCENTKQNSKKMINEKIVKGGKSMVEAKRNTMLWIVIGVLLIATIFLTFKASSKGTDAEQSNGKIDTASMTANEKMNYEMHGTIPARFQGKVSPSSAPSGAGMVGGC